MGKIKNRLLFLFLLLFAVLAVKQASTVYAASGDNIEFVFKDDNSLEFIYHTSPVVHDSDIWLYKREAWYAYRNKTGDDWDKDEFNAAKGFKMGTNDIQPEGSDPDDPTKVVAKVSPVDVTAFLLANYSRYELMNPMGSEITFYLSPVIKVAYYDKNEVEKPRGYYNNIYSPWSFYGMNPLIGYLGWSEKTKQVFRYWTFNRSLTVQPQHTFLKVHIVDQDGKEISEVRVKDLVSNPYSDVPAADILTANFILYGERLQSISLKEGAAIEGYTYKGYFWSDDGSLNKLVPERATPSDPLIAKTVDYAALGKNKPLELYFVFEKDPGPLCKVTFHSNDGTDQIKIEEVIAGTEYTLPSCMFTAPSGKEFSAWECEGGKPEYKEGAVITIKDDVDLYAVWADKTSPVPEYTVTVEIEPAGSGTVKGAGKYKQDSTVNLVAEPASGYTSVIFSSTDLNIISTESVLTFTMPAKNVKVQVIFIADPPPGSDSYYAGPGTSYVEVKEGTPGNETFEAMAGVPTTEDLYVAFGASQYAVGYDVEEATSEGVRTYTLMYTAVSVGDDEPCEYSCPGHTVDNYKNGCGKLLCTKTEHTHDYSCRELNCSLEHTHTDSCYTYVCGKSEHTHSISCYCRTGTYQTDTCDHGPVTLTSTCGCSAKSVTKTFTPKYGTGYITCKNINGGNNFTGMGCVHTEHQNATHTKTVTYTGKITQPISEFTYIDIKALEIWRITKLEFKGNASLFSNPNRTEATAPGYRAFYSQSGYSSDNGRLKFSYSYDTSQKYGDTTIAKSVSTKKLQADCDKDANAWLNAQISGKKVQATVISDYLQLDSTEGYQTLVLNTYKSDIVSITDEVFELTTATGDTAAIQELLGTEITFSNMPTWSSMYTTPTTKMVFTGYNGKYNQPDKKFTTNNVGITDDRVSRAGIDSTQPNSVDVACGSVDTYMLDFNIINSTDDNGVWSDSDGIEPVTNGQYATGNAYVTYTRAVKYQSPSAGTLGTTSTVTKEARYRNGTTKANDIIVFNPISINNFALLSADSKYDQRTEESKKASDEYANDTTNEVCPGDSTCEFAVLDCKITPTPHTAECYADVATTEKVHAVGFNSHTHVPACYKTVLINGVPMTYLACSNDLEVHHHTDDCYEGHAHTEDCYQEHQHTRSCYESANFTVTVFSGTQSTAAGDSFEVEYTATQNCFISYSTNVTDSYPLSYSAYINGNLSEEISVFGEPYKYYVKRGQTIKLKVTNQGTSDLTKMRVYLKMTPGVLSCNEDHQHSTYGCSQRNIVYSLDSIESTLSGIGKAYPPAIKTTGAEYVDLQVNLTNSNAEYVRCIVKIGGVVYDTFDVPGASFRIPVSDESMTFVVEGYAEAGVEWGFSARYISYALDSSSCTKTDKELICGLENTLEIVCGYAEGEVIQTPKSPVANAHVCTDECTFVTKKELTCTNPHHYEPGSPYDPKDLNNHYGFGDARCWSPCLDDEKHKQISAVEVDGVEVDLSSAFNLLGREFTVYSDNLGDFEQVPDLHGLADCSAYLGMGYTNDMDTTKWIRDKYIVFPFDCMDERGSFYLAGTAIDLLSCGDGPYYTFTLVISNSVAGVLFCTKQSIKICLRVHT